MRSLLGVLGGTAIFCGTGAGILQILKRWDEPEDDPLGLAWCFLVGSAFVGLLLHLPLVIDGRIGHGSFALLLGLGSMISVGYGIRYWRRRAAGTSGALDPFRPLPLWLRLTAIGILLLALSTAAKPLSGWDGRAIFALKARILYGTGNLRSEDFVDPYRLNLQTRYPLLVPLLEATLFFLQGSFDDRLTKILFLAFLLSLVSIFVEQIRRYDSPKVAAFWGFLLLSTPLLIEPGSPGLTGFADLPFAAFVTGAVLQLGRWLEHPSARAAILSGSLLGAALLTKQEGIIWAMAIGAAAVTTVLAYRLHFPRQERNAVIALAGIPFLFLFVSVLARRWIPHSPFSERYAAVLNVKWLVQVWSRPFLMVPYLLRQLIGWRRWGAGWLCILAGLLLLRRKSHPPWVFFSRITVGLVLCADLAIFVVTPYHLYWHLITALPRLLLQLYPLALLVLSEQVAASGWLAELRGPGEAR